MSGEREEGFAGLHRRFGDRGVAEQRCRRLLGEAEAVERRGHARAVRAQEQVAEVGVDGGLQAGVGHLDARPATGVGQPAGRDLRGGGEGRHVERTALERQDDAQRRGVGEREDERRLRRALRRAGRHRGLGRGVAAEHDVGDAALVAGARDAATRGAGRHQHEPSVDAHLGAFGGDLRDGALPVEAARAHGQRDRERHAGAVLDLDDDHGHATHVASRVGAVDRVAAGHAELRLDDGCCADELLAHRGLVSRQVPAVLRTDPPVERPPLRVELHEAARVDAREANGIERADHRSAGRPGGPVL